MSFKAMAWAAQVRTGNHTKKLILLLLADRANDQGFCFPSIARIASDCELFRTTVMRNIKAMESDGLLRTQKRGNGKSNIYHLNIGGSVERLVAESDLGGSGERLQVVAESDTNLSVEPIIETIIAPEGGAGVNNTAHCPAKTQKPPKPPAKFLKPEILDVADHIKSKCDEKGFHVSVEEVQRQSEKFWNHHEANEWMRNGRKMKIWKSAANVWMLNNYDKVFTKNAATKRMQI